MASSIESTTRIARIGPRYSVAQSSSVASEAAGKSVCPREQVRSSTPCAIKRLPIAGKKFYLQTVGERERATNAVARLLQLGNPIETEGAEGSEKIAGEEPKEEGEAPTPAEETAEETES